MGQINTTQIRPPFHDRIHLGAVAHGGAPGVDVIRAPGGRSLSQRKKASVAGKSNPTSYVDIRENRSTTQLQVRSFTWHRDSHGLFDYESKTVTQNFIKCNYSTILHRFENEILFEEMQSLQQADPTLSTMAAVLYEKQSNYWLYHKTLVEDDEEEKQHPADKAWLIVKFANPTPNAYNPHSKGYRLRIGDTVKFGRVRFKVIMLSNEVDGDQVFKESRFKKPAAKKGQPHMGSRSSLGNTNSDEEEDEEDDEHGDEDEEDFGGLHMEEEDDAEAFVRGNALIIGGSRPEGNNYDTNFLRNTTHLQGSININDHQFVTRMHSHNPDGLNNGSFLQEHGLNLPPMRGRTSNFPENESSGLMNHSQNNIHNMLGRRNKRRKQKLGDLESNDFLSPSPISGGAKKRTLIKHKSIIPDDQGLPICRICLCEEETPITNPLISPCKCNGSMKFIHIECLREWLNSKSSFKESNPPGVKTYCWKALECELCKCRFPDRIVSPDQNEKIINLIYFEKPETDYLVLESVTQQNIKIIHVLDMSSNDYIKVGRGHDSQVRVTDISVSRFHALFRKSPQGDFILEDNNSKFGTLVLIRRPYMLLKNNVNYFQIGRSLVECSVKEPSRCCNLKSLCSISKVKQATKKDIAFDGEDFFPEEFVPKQIHEFTMEEEGLQKQGTGKMSLSQNNKKLRPRVKSLSSNRIENPISANPNISINGQIQGSGSGPASQRRANDVIGGSQVIQVENLNSYQGRFSSHNPKLYSFRKSFTVDNANNGLLAVNRHELIAITESPNNGRNCGSSPDAISKFNEVQGNDYEEEDAKEECGVDMESSQTFLNPLGVSINDNSPAFIANRKQKLMTSLAVEDIKEEDADDDNYNKSTIVHGKQHEEETKHTRKQDHKALSPQSTFSDATVELAKQQHNFCYEKTPVAEADSYLQDGSNAKFKMSHVSRQLTQQNPGQNESMIDKNNGSLYSAGAIHEDNNNLSEIYLGQESQKGGMQHNVQKQKSLKQFQQWITDPMKVAANFDDSISNEIQRIDEELAALEGRQDTIEVQQKHELLEPQTARGTNKINSMQIDKDSPANLINFKGQSHHQEEVEQTWD